MFWSCCWWNHQGNHSHISWEAANAPFISRAREICLEISKWAWDMLSGYGFGALSISLWCVCDALAGDASPHPGDIGKGNKCLFFDRLPLLGPHETLCSSCAIQVQHLMFSRGPNGRDLQMITFKTPWFYSTYPTHMIMPTKISENTLQYATKYRNKYKIPTLIYSGSGKYCIPWSLLFPQQQWFRIGLYGIKYGIWVFLLACAFFPECAQISIL